MGSDRARQLGRGRICRGREIGPWRANGLPPADPVAILVVVPCVFGQGRPVCGWLRLSEFCSARRFRGVEQQSLSLSMCQTQCPSRSYVEKSKVAHVLRDDGISVQSRALIGRDERHRRKYTARQSSGALSIQAYLGTYTPQHLSTYGGYGSYGFGLGLKEQYDRVVLSKTWTDCVSDHCFTSIRPHPIPRHIVMTFSASPKRWESPEVRLSHKHF